MSAAFAALLVIFPNDPTFIAIGIFGSSFGTNAAFAMVYYINGEIFPALLVPFAFSIENIIARVITMGAPYYAEIEAPIPILTMLINTCISIVLTIIVLKMPKKH